MAFGNITAYDWIMYVSIFFLGVIVGRISMAIQVELMKGMAKTKKKSTSKTKKNKKQ